MIEVQIRAESKPNLKTSQPLTFGTRRKEREANHTNLDINYKVILISTIPININDMICMLLRDRYVLRSEGRHVPLHPIKAYWAVEFQIQTQTRH